MLEDIIVDIRMVKQYTSIHLRSTMISLTHIQKHTLFSRRRYEGVTKRDLEYYLAMHKQMWLDMAKRIAHCQHTIDIYQYKLSWCSNRNLAPIHKCFACQCAFQMKWDAGDVEEF